MSSPIWTPAALLSDAHHYAGTGWRLVEAQHRVSTLKLVDTLAEQAALEDILEATKPQVPAECRGLDYLLATPFRYGPYPYGSRFRRAGHTPGVWYAAEAAHTALAEMVFYRFLFFAESPATPWPENTADYTGFAVPLAGLAIDLTAPPLLRDDAVWRHPTDYTATQNLADAARDAAVQIIRYASVRDPGGGANLAVLACAAFAAREPALRQTWRIRLGPQGAQAICEHPVLGLEFGRDAFADPRLSGMIWDRPRFR